MEETLNVEEVFCAMPKLVEYFRELEGEIKNFQPTEGIGEGVEGLKRKRRELLGVACDLGGTDLQILYYLRNLTRLSSYQLLTALKRLFQAQEELKETLRIESKPLL